jgi:hypothetical protein
MAGFSFSCPNCGKALRAGGQRAGPRRVVCPQCAHRFAVTFPEREDGSDAGLAAATTPDLPEGWIPLDPDPRPAPRVDTSVETPAALSIDALLGETSAGGPSPLVLRHKPSRDRLLRWLGPASLVVGLLVAAGLFAWDRVHRPAPRPGGTPGTPVIAARGDAPAAATASPVEPAKTANEPIVLLLAPAGARLVIHVRPAELWGKNPRAEELRRCLPELAAWSAARWSEWCLFSPEEIDEALFAFVLQSPSVPPELAATVRLQKPSGLEEIARRFGGQRLEKAGRTSYAKGKRALVVLDETTFAVGPLSAVDEMIEAAAVPSPTDESIEELLKQTDRRWTLALIARPDDLERYRQALFSPAWAELAGLVARWLQPDSTEAAAISVELADPFRIRLALRNRPAIPRGRLADDVSGRLGRLPSKLAEEVRTLRPGSSGRRKLIGRLPAMWKAVSLGTTPAVSTRLVTFESVLPEKAAPNLALGSMLAWNEFHAGPTADRPGGVNGKSGKGTKTSAAERLQKRIVAEFRRTPLSEALATIADEVGLANEIDGTALKEAGYTKNLPQSFRVEGPAIEALRTIVKTQPKLALFVDESRGTLILTTKEAAAATGRKPLELP